MTARRVQERLQDVPISMTVYDQSQLDKRNIVTATDLGTYTPSLSVNQRFGPEKSSYAIRGFVQDQGTAPSVGVYFADVVVPRAAGGTTSGNNVITGSFMDLENVQVLKGPQGTLFGRNTTGGAVILIPKKPTSRFEGYVEGSAGDYGLLRGQGVLNIPVSDKLRVRMGVDRNQRDGYMKNHSGIGPDDYNNVDYFAARFSAVADITPDLENYIVATYSSSFANGYAARIVECNPNPPPNTTAPLFGLGVSSVAFTAGAACDQLARQSARGDGPLDVEVDARDPYIRLRAWQLVNTTTWEAADTLTLKNIVSYSEFRERSSFSLNSDNFTTSFPPSANYPGGFPAFNGQKFQYIRLDAAPGQEGAGQSTFTEEFRLEGRTPDDRLNWQAGVYLEISNPLGFASQRTSILANCTDPEHIECSAVTFPVTIFGTPSTAASSISYSSRKFWFESMGVYGQATYKIFEPLALTAGYRYTWDESDALGMDTRISIATRVQTCNDVVRFGVGAVAANQQQCSLQFKTSSNKPTWMLNLKYNITPDANVYVTYSRGYRAGGLNLTAIGVEGWQPEKVDAYEIGAKMSFRGAVRGYLNIAAFYNDFTNQQLFVTAISNVAGFAGANPIMNAGKSRIQGFELDASATVLEGLRLDLGYTFLDTVLESIKVPPVPSGAPYSAFIPTAGVDSPLVLSPKNRATFTATYTLPLSETIGEISVGGTLVYTDSQYFSQATLPQYRQAPATTLVNFNVDWSNIAQKPIDLAFFMTNVTDEIYPVNVGQSYNSAGFENLLYAPPRMWGFRAKYRFGE